MTTTTTTTMSLLAYTW